MKRLTIALLAAATLVSAGSAEARHRHHHRHHVTIADPGCNVIFPCEGVTVSKRGERIVKAMGGFGSAQKHYRRANHASATILPHPSGCPHRAFCGCGAAVNLFGRPIRSHWLAAHWFIYPPTSPAHNMVAVRRHHVMVLKQHVAGNVWMVYDANSGGHATRYHARSIAGYSIRNPHAKT